MAAILKNRYAVKSAPGWFDLDKIWYVYANHMHTATAMNVQCSTKGCMQ